MFNFKKIIFIILLLPTFAFAQGFSTPGDNTNQHVSAEEIVKFSKKVEKYLASKGARVAIVSRLGRAESELPEGVKYTHVAYWVYSTITTPEGKKVPGYVAYNLYQREKETDVSDLVMDFPIEFFSGVYQLKAGIIIPKVSLQQKLLNVITSADYQKLHIPKYSVVANPNNERFQNCTEFTLDVLMSALYNTNDYKQIKANIKAYFKPQVVKIGAIKSILGSLFVQDFSTKDQNGPIITATFSTLAKFMQDYDLVADVHEIIEK